MGSVLPPEVSMIKEPTRCRCKHCEKQIKVGDIVINYISSYYHNSHNMALLHLGCLIKTAPNDCSFETIMMALGQGGK